MNRQTLQACNTTPFQRPSYYLDHRAVLTCPPRSLHSPMSCLRRHRRLLRKSSSLQRLCQPTGQHHHRPPRPFTRVQPLRIAYLLEPQTRRLFRPRRRRPSAPRILSPTPCSSSPSKALPLHRRTTPSRHRHRLITKPAHARSPSAMHAAVANFQLVQTSSSLRDLARGAPTPSKSPAPSGAAANPRAQSIVNPRHHRPSPAGAFG